MSKTTASSFLQNMKVGGEQTPAAAVAVESQAVRKTTPQKTAPKASGRAGLKHIGGYFDPSTVERVALLRARLALDNSELLKLAVDELYSREKAKRAFAD